MRTRHSAPIANSYWLPGGMVAAGEYPGSLESKEANEKIGRILDAGITSFIDLTERGELEPYEPLLRAAAEARGTSVRYSRISIRDMSVCSTRTMASILDEIDADVQAGRKVYVHCWGGVGRTGTVVGCYFVRQGHAPGDALDLVGTLFSAMSPSKLARHPEGSPQTREQRRLVRQWKDRQPEPPQASRPPREPGTARRDQEHVRGCLLGGAVGDALGAPVEFMRLRDIRRHFGEQGITDLQPYDGRIGSITDDTQMTLWTAEGLLRAETRGRDRGICHPPTIVYHAYLRWLRTQGAMGPDVPYVAERPGWLFGVRALYARRAPGTTCLSALRSGEMGTIQHAINDSKGCGGVMRAAPCGLVAFDWADPFTLGCETAAITHSHPSGYLAAGCLALMVREVIVGASLEQAVREALERVRGEDRSSEVVAALEGAISAVQQGEPSAEVVERLGGGWVAEEALAIAVYSALAADGDFARGVRLAVNHGGDSDSTGAIAGNLLGASLGVRAIPSAWLEKLELRHEIAQLADDVLTGYRDAEEWRDRYPGC